MLALLFPLMGIIPAAAQQTIGSAGGVLSGPGTTWEYNIGEAIIGTVSSPVFTLTQGFEQPWVEIITLTPVPDREPAVSVFPNPVRHFLNIVRPEGSDDMHYHMFDGSGRLVLSAPLSSIRTELDTAPLQSGAYILQVTSDRPIPDQTFRIIITH